MRFKFSFTRALILPHLASFAAWFIQHTQVGVLAVQISNASLHPPLADKLKHLPPHTSPPVCPAFPYPHSSDQFFLLHFLNFLSPSLLAPPAPDGLLFSFHSNLSTMHGGFGLTTCLWMLGMASVLSRIFFFFSFFYEGVNWRLLHPVVVPVDTCSAKQCREGGEGRR